MGDSAGKQRTPSLGFCMRPSRFQFQTLSLSKYDETNNTKISLAFFVYLLGIIIIIGQRRDHDKGRYKKP